MKQFDGQFLSRKLTVSLWTAILVLDILVGIGAWLSLDSSRRNYEERATTTATNATQVFDQAISIYVRQIDLASLYIADRLEEQLRNGGRIQEAEFSRFLKQQNERLAGDIGIRVCDATGIVFLGKDVVANDKISWRDRNFFQILATQPERGLYVTDPLFGRVTKAGQIAFIRRYNQTDGSFAGLVSISISLQSLGELLKAQDLGPNGVALLRDSQRRLIVRFPAVESPEGQTGAKGYSKELGAVMDSGRSSGTYHAVRTSDGVERTNAYLRLTSVPFHLVTGVASQDYLEQWRNEIRNTSIAVAAYIAMTAILGWMLWKSLRLVRYETEQTRLLLRGATDGISILDQNGQILRASESFCDALGYSHGEMVGKTIHSLEAAMSPDAVSRTIDKVFHDGKVLTFESAHRHKDGSAVPVEVTAKRLMLNGQPIIFTSTRYIAERLRLARELSESESRFRQLIEKNQSVMLEINPESGRILDANDSAARYYGYPIKTLTEMSITQINTASPQAVAIEMQLAVHEGRGYFNFFHQLASGEIREVEVYSTLLEVRGQKHLFSIVHDISVRRLVEQNLKHLADEQRAILDSAIVGICKLKDRRMVWVNEAYAMMFGYCKDELIGQTTEMFYLDNEAAKAFAEAAYPTIKAGGAFRKQVQFRRKGGTLGWYDVAGTLVSPQSMESVWALTDITKLVEAEFAQRLSSSVFANSYDGIVITDTKNLIVDVNPAYCRISGYARDEVLGKNPSLISSGRQSDDFYKSMWTSLLQSDFWQGEVWNRRKTGEIYAEMLSLSAVRNARGEVQNFIGVSSDISSLKLHEQELDRFAHYDPLTGLPNRRQFQDQLKHELQLAQRTGGEVALILIDLDRFKEVNDTLGHDTGDRLLEDVGKRLQACVRESDSIARIGGDEFVVVMPGLQGQAAVIRVAQAIVDVMQTVFWLQGQEVFVSASVGVAIFPEDATDGTTLFKHADQAMYEAKGLGRNRFEFFKKSMQSLAEARISLGRALRHALAQAQFEMHYQPIIDLTTGRIVKCEALIRWRHPEHGLICPAEFISIAEDVGLIGPIGDWVFRQATSDIAKINATLASQAPSSEALNVSTARVPISVGVNVSPKQFHNGLDHDGWLAHLVDIGLPPELAIVEITEGLLLDNRPEVATQLLAFRDAGIQVAIDDFGTGYSALSYLTKFHIDYLKVDQSFVQRIESNLEDRAIVEAIVSMAHKLGMKVIAKGIETDSQRRLLEAALCDLGQGYHFAKPMRIEELWLLLSNRSMAF